MGLLHRRTWRLLALALSGLWIVTLASAETDFAPGMRCHHMPCCPRSGGNGESCTGTRCTEQVPEKSESEVVQARERPSAAPSTPKAVSGNAAPAPVRELTSGLAFRTPVFRLKDDLRI
jgi:hypothetical protein